MWKRIKVLFKSFKDFIVSMFKNATDNVTKAIEAFGWTVVPIAFVCGYILLMLPQLAVFAVIASFTSGIQDPILKFVAGILVFTGMELVLISVAWMAVVVMGLPEMLRFATYIIKSYEKRLVEEEIREGELAPITVQDSYNRLKNHNV